MVRHVVLFEFMKESEGKSAIENAVKAKDKLLALKDKIDCLKRMEVGINDGEADATNYTLCLVCDFETIDDLQVYQNHPEHLEVAAFIAKVKLSRACVDYEVNE
ncbi:Dabb family protein [Anaeromicropila populeti]|uniref:Stress responsive A/B Barrel Domain n=1 Tax=Anaeromicropila populeti TaxID=37658 RepID=A0A1I6JZH5_9FIRM|nr:Dabb family protein [Anaeromicropila populeti]SFR84278.1 Stress responsive A/B Barrel Domain [Anaeromicropila populeti]